VSATIEAVILGCGSSGGVPRADGNWGACDPAEPKNRRTRCSMLVRRLGEGAPTTVLVDTAPELRQQTAAAGVKHLDAVLYTHDHADQVHGIDDVRAFLLTSGRRVPAYMDPPTRERLARPVRLHLQGRGLLPAADGRGGDAAPEQRL
jgi:phosphoribosyl 1,2-cyclic phosphate phosphodiesterase